jgi:hypothetical protein
MNYFFFFVKRYDWHKVKPRFFAIVKKTIKCANAIHPRLQQLNDKKTMRSRVARWNIFVPKIPNLIGFGRPFSGKF